MSKRKRDNIIKLIADTLSVDAGDEHPMYWLNEAELILEALEQADYVIARRSELEDVADRISGCTRATISTSLSETPRKSEHVPTLIEVSMTHFKTIEQDLRALIPENESLKTS